MNIMDRDLPLSGAIDLRNPDVVNWVPLYDAPTENKRRTISSLPQLESRYSSLTVSEVTTAASDLKDSTPQSPRTPSRLRGQNYTKRARQPQLEPPRRREDLSQANTSLGRPSSPVPTSTRPPSRLPRPIISTTPVRESITPLPCQTRKPYLRHSLRQSMTTNDIASLRDPKVQDPMLEQIEESPRTLVGERVRMITSPSKLPRLASSVVVTPAAKKWGCLRERRFASTPVSLPSHRKENVIPVRLLRPVSPTQAQSTVHAQAQPLQPIHNSQVLPPHSIPKSRTVGMLSNIRSTFRRSRSSLNIDQLNPRKSSASSATSTIDMLLADLLATESKPIAYIWGSQETKYWAGRFSSAHDRFNNENLSTSLANIHTPTPSDQLNDPRELVFTAADDDAKFKRVFLHLGTMCIDDGARKSLYSFQLQFARVKGRPGLLPEGGKMEPLLERLGKRVEGAWSRRMSSRLG